MISRVQVLLVCSTCRASLESTARLKTPLRNQKSLSGGENLLGIRTQSACHSLRKFGILPALEVVVES